MSREHLQQNILNVNNLPEIKQLHTKDNRVSMLLTVELNTHSSQLAHAVQHFS